jgi:hypothetical protein
MINKSQLIHKRNLAVNPMNLAYVLFFFVTVLTNRSGRGNKGVPHSGHNEAAVPSQPVLFCLSCCGGVRRTRVSPADCACRNCYRLRSNTGRKPFTVSSQC